MVDVSGKNSEKNRGSQQAHVFYGTMFISLAWYIEGRVGNREVQKGRYRSRWRGRREQFDKKRSASVLRYKYGMQ